MMKRRTLLGYLAATPWLGLAVGGVARSGQAQAAAEESLRLDKPLADWRRLLTPERFSILFEEHTEPPFTSALNDEHRDGTFVCAACYLPLFTSASKFDSGTGWPSFTGPIKGRTGTRKDFKLIWPRTEYHCARCGGHQGHVFNDGPAPRGERWCNNGLALQFVAADEDLPELRT
jgi:peptide-methionine (R)-S-oxide reductase